VALKLNHLEMWVSYAHDYSRSCLSTSQILGYLMLQTSQKQ